jgi:hypothetical protein
MMGSTENRFYCKSRYIKDGIVGLIIWVLRVNPWHQLSIDISNITKQDGERIRCDSCSGDIHTNIWDITEVFWRQTLWLGLYVPRSDEAVSKSVGNGHDDSNAPFLTSNPLTKKPCNLCLRLFKTQRTTQAITATLVKP